LGRDIKYAVLSWWVLKIGSPWQNLKETQELLLALLTISLNPQSSKINCWFKITSYQEGIRIILDDYKIK
jgi:hypothetical protein